MFYDEARIYVKSGDGGDGAIHFHREKYMPFGGPDGGDGGRGGDIVFKVNPKLNSLAHFHRQVHFRASAGQRGNKNNQTGANGENLILETPPGTVIRDGETGAVLADLTMPGQEIMLLPGGRGGRGNARYATSRDQAPRMAEGGEPGQEKWLALELKLIADVGLVGVPNAGKSTLLSVISAARPKIANYPFTTLQPNLGVVALDGFETLVMADIPGLIEGAAAGAGLGHEFLRHIERTRILIHLLDGAAAEPLHDWEMINRELTLYPAGLSQKPQLVVLNKIDLPDAVAWEPIIQEVVEAAGHPFCAISALTGQGIRAMLYRVQRLLVEQPAEPTPRPTTPTVIHARPDPNHFTIEREGDNWRVRGERIERAAQMTYFHVPNAAFRFQRLLEQLGIDAALRTAGVTDGDLVFFGDIELEWQEEDARP